MAVENSGGTLLVTGATGFVGSHVIEAYQRSQKYRLRVLVRRESAARKLEQQGISCVLGSLENRDAVQEAIRGVDGVLHLAAVTKARTPAEYQRANAAGTEVVVEAMLAAQPRPKRLVYLSSLAAVGPSRDGRPVTAFDEPMPLTTYGRTKLAGEKICTAVADSFEVAVLRAPAVYGPRDRDVYEFFRMARYGVLPLPSGPDRSLQMIHAADLARALLLAATSDGVCGVYHVAEARSYRWQEMAGMVAEAVGKRARIVRVPPAVIAAAAAVNETVLGLFGKSTIFNRDKARELLAPGWLCETDSARRDFGFRAEISLSAGLKQTAEWYRAEGWL